MHTIFKYTKHISQLFDMKIAVVGSRTISDEKLVIQFMLECHEFNTEYDKIISGGARGVDSIAEDFAKEHNIRTKIFKPQWDKYRKQAGFIRNADIIGNCDKCICIWDGESLGTKNDIELCEQMSKPCYVLNIKTGRKTIPEPSLFD